MARSEVRGAGGSAEAVAAHPRTIAKSGTRLFTVRQVQSNAIMMSGSQIAYRQVPRNPSSGAQFGLIRGTPIAPIRDHKEMRIEGWLRQAGVCGILHRSGAKPESVLLFHNDSAGKFTEVSHQAGIDKPGKGLGVAIAELRSVQLNRYRVRNCCLCFASRLDTKRRV
jgi:hypothetical protein